MKLRLPAPIHVGTTVQVHLSFAIALGEVRYCEAAKNDFFTGILLADVCCTGPRRDTRQEARYPVNVPGSLRAERSALVHEIAVLDVSKSGLRIRCREAIPQGAIVEVECSGATIAGEVRYVRTLDEGQCNMGIQAHYMKANGTPNSAFDLTLVFYPEISS